MKRNHRKLLLSRETIKLLEGRALSQVLGQSGDCTDTCDTDRECSSLCLHLTNGFGAC